MIEIHEHVAVTLCNQHTTTTTASRDMGIDPRFPRKSGTSELKIDTPGSVLELVSPVSIHREGVTASLNRNVCLRVAAPYNCQSRSVPEIQSPWCWDVKRPSNNNHFTTALCNKCPRDPTSPLYK